MDILFHFENILEKNVLDKMSQNLTKYPLVNKLYYIG